MYGPRRFLLKGGVAMELRLRLRARATKDIDIVVFAETDDDLVDTLRAALETDYLGFGFRLARVESIADTCLGRARRPRRGRHRGRGGAI